MSVTWGMTMNARNEEKNIGETLESVKNQTIKPIKMVVCNDGSTDRTKEIAESLGAMVVDYPDKHPNWVSKPELALTINLALKEFDNIDFDYMLLMGADNPLDPDYVEKITSAMQSSPTIKLASGVVEGEFNITPRGSGRIVDARWWKKYGLRYKAIHGWESWLLHRVLADGYDLKIIEGVFSTTQRKTGTNYTEDEWRNRGRAFKSLGYINRFVIGRMIILILKRHSIKDAVQLWKGFTEKNNMLCEEDLREFTKKTQSKEMSIKNMKNLTIRFLQIQRRRGKE